MNDPAEPIHELIDDIQALAHILSLLFEVVENCDIAVNPHCVARFAKMITHKAVQISALLDQD